jgi:chromate reductase
MKILGICGSLREGSYNQRVLDAAADVLEAPASLAMGDCGQLPFYNEDTENAGRPESVATLLGEIAAADALLIATPEYNHSVSAVLKNALDWASRPAFKSVLVGKPCGILSASMSPVGGARAQQHLKSILSSTLSLVYPAPDCTLPMAQDAFDKTGELIDDAVRRRLRRYVNDFANWAAEATT